MKRLIPILLIFIIFSSAFSAKIDPYLLKEFNHKSSNFQLFSEPEEKFFVWYKGEAPSGNIIKEYPFNVVEMEGTLSDVKKIANNSNVIYIFGNRPVRLFLNETINQTNSSIGDTPEIFSKYNGSGVKLEVIDQGANWSLFNAKHYRLSDNIGNHGTFVISEIVSNRTPYLGIARGVTLYDGNTFVSGTLDEVFDGINWGLSNGVNIESMSFGISSVGFGSRDAYLQLLFDSIFSENNNTLFVIAAGNNGTKGLFTIAQPGSSTPMNVITVGANDKNGNIMSFSSRGPLESNRIKPDICATGILYGFLADGKVAPLLGTSMATPLVAGAAALIKQANPSLTPKEIKLILMEGANQKDVFSCGAGVLNVSKSISLLNSTIIEVDDNYLGYVGNNTSFKVGLRNFKNTSQTINVTIEYYNGTVWNSTTLLVKANSSNYTIFNLRIPNLPWNESYGYIILNDSAHLPFSWAKSIFISPYNLNKEITINNKFYTLNYSALPKGIPLPLFDVNSYGNNVSFGISEYDNLTEMTSLDKDLSGFSFENNSIGSFVMYPEYPRQVGNGKFYNLLNESGTLSLWILRDKMTNQKNETFTGKRVFKIESSVKPLVLVDGKECMNTIIDNVVCISNYVFSFNDSAKINIYDTSPFDIYSYSFDGEKNVNSIEDIDVDNLDLYLFNYTSNGIMYFEIVPIFSYPTMSIHIPSIIYVKPMSPVKITVNLTNGDSNLTYPFYIWFKAEGLFDKNQIVILNKEAQFHNGKAQVNFDFFANKNNITINYCLGELETDNGTINCNGIETENIILFSNDGQSEKIKNYVDINWLSSLVETISKMLYLYVNSK